MHEQNCCFANLNLLLFQPFSFLSPSLSPLLLICSHFILFAFSLFHSPLLSISTSCCERCFCMPWAHGSVAQIASHAWEHYLIYSLCTDASYPQKNSEKENRRLCCADINCFPQMSLSQTFF